MLICPRYKSEKIKQDPLMAIYFCSKCGYNGTFVIEQDETTK